jgi:hypothetical protein
MSSNKTKKVFCTNCGTWCGSGRKYCKDCRLKRKQELKEQSINAKKSDAIYTHGHISNKYAKIRYHARHDFEKSITKCQKCGYDKHVEICHIKSIKEFPDSATIAEINNKSNIIGLCPNCHWEFDHGLLNITTAIIDN